MSHTHRDAGPVCVFPTKKECNKNYSVWKLQKKAEYELKLIERAEAEKLARLKTYHDYAEKEARRMSEGGPPV